jgi:hypothetical protein
MKVLLSRVLPVAVLLAGTVLTLVADDEPTGQDFCIGNPPGAPGTPSPCVAQPDSCTPLNPPPTTWNPICCRPVTIENELHCIQVYWRVQCCRRSGTGVYYWGRAWKEEDKGITMTCILDECL